eukprot:TCALIF_01920-PA protein Name:"Similar to ANK2 Ankyrin-2 (Homo sapiens)" AED:0.42 eAED:0.42 QI:11/0.75/0.4/0.8/1/1/5/0/1087
MERSIFLDPKDPRLANGQDSDVDSIDSPMMKPKSPFALLFNDSSRYTVRERRLSKESRRSSQSSLDSSFISAIKEKDRSNLPQNEQDIHDLVLELGENFKRTVILKEALKTSWVWTRPNQCFESGNTILHIAAKLGEHKLVGALTHLCVDVNGTNNRGDTPMHLAAEFGQHNVIQILLKRGANLDLFNNLSFKPIQVAAIKCHGKCLEVLIKYDSNYRILNDQKETLIHLACRASFAKLLTIKEEVTDLLGGIDSVEHSKSSPHFCQDLESRERLLEQDLYDKIIPVFDLLLSHFRRSPDLLEIEDTISTSPGTILHYFAALNLVEGARTLLSYPFQIDPNFKNKNGYSPLVIAAFYNHITLGGILLDNKANPNDKDPNTEDTALHFAIYGYHLDRVDETCKFIGKLLENGANPKLTSKSGEAPMHMVIGTLDFRLMVQFIDYLGSESLEMRDDNGNTLFHHAVACLDENSVTKLIEMGANLMNKTQVDVEIEEDPEVYSDFSGDDIRVNGITENVVLKSRISTKSVAVQRLPLQEAMQSGNSKNYFNAIGKSNFAKFSEKWSPSQVDEFLRSHLLGATREVRPDIVRLLFHEVKDVKKLHKILLYCDKHNEDDTFTKTALEWAVENDDRLCTTEILHQEFKCHQNDKKAGLNCLRRQLRGDELLVWTIETFTMFYDRQLVNILVHFLWTLTSLLCAPFFILYVAARNVYYKFRHRRATKKNLFRKQLQKSEYLWGITRTAEAGLESCGQLILQVWLLSSDFKELSEESFWGLVDKTYNGVIFFLTFSYKNADDIEKSLGKLLMSLIALVFGVSGCYRTLKRGAVKFSNTYFIYISLVFQIFARIFSIGLYFFAVRQFFPIVPILLVTHLIFVFIIKWTFERARHTHGMLAWLVSFVNVVASSLVYVRIVPIEKQRPSKWNRETTSFLPSHEVIQHSTFFVQTLFFLLVLFENILLACTPLMYPSGRAFACLGTAKINQYVLTIIGLCMASWLSHVMYYKYMGHPWSDINGPTCSAQKVKFSFHVCGREKLFQCACSEESDSEEFQEGTKETETMVKKIQCRCTKCRITCSDFQDTDQEDSDSEMQE